MHTMQSQGWKLWETGSDSHKELCQKWDAECPWIHILDTHLDKFKESTRAYLEEQGKHFHQDMMDFERHNQGLHNEDIHDGGLFEALYEKVTCSTTTNLKKQLISECFSVILIIVTYML